MDSTSKNLYTIAFYNLENLFDTIDDPDTLDDDFTPNGRKKWNEKRYYRKQKKLSSVIAQIGKEETKKSPSIVGIAEVENIEVIKDLIFSKKLVDEHYGIVHYDSSDERGIEVALLYKKEDFELLNSETFSVLLYDEEGERDYTRDILFVTGKLKGEKIYCFVNHWPSRRKGAQETEHRRILVAKRLQELVGNIAAKDDDAKIIIMGDFNDNPNDRSVKQYLLTEGLYNPYESLYDKGKGTVTHEKNWLLFDQIILSQNFFEGNTVLKYTQAEIFDEHFLKSWKGKRKGSPFRTYIGKWHQGGYSDHFPVYIVLEKKP
ncbi:MAG: endonuclease [Flavobacteriaceae bacterium]|nr:endonuclease [Flavobacteriaceae bacterium]